MGVKMLTSWFSPVLESKFFSLYNNNGIYKRYIYAKHNTKESTTA